LTDAVKREIKEETGLEVEPGLIIESFDRIHRDEDGRIRYHFVIIDYVCHISTGAAVAGSDAIDVAWITADEIERYGINPHAAAVIRRGLSAI
jgi:ADP-ribose pyrophosphatase YjhB (NUDIX family)